MIKDKCNEDDAGIFIEYFMDALIWLSVVFVYCWYKALLLFMKQIRNFLKRRKRICLLK
jgi:hypothetical protein